MRGGRGGEWRGAGRGNLGGFLRLLHRAFQRGFQFLWKGVRKLAFLGRKKEKKRKKRKEKEKKKKKKKRNRKGNKIR